MVLAAATRPRRTASARRWAAGRHARLCPDAVVVAAADGGLLGGQQGGVRGLQTTRRRSSRACRSTRRSSTCAGCGGSPARRAGDRRRLRRDVREEVGLPITVGIARTKFLAKVASARRQARRPARGAAGRRARVPAPAARRAAVGRRPGDGRASARARHHAPSAQVARLGEETLVVDRSAAAPGATCTPWPTTATRGRCASAAGAARWAAARARPPARSHEELDAILVGLVDRCRPAAARGTPGRAARSSCACASATSRGRPARTRSTRPPTETETILATARGLLAAAMPLIDRQGSR